MIIILHLSFTCPLPILYAIQSFTYPVLVFSSGLLDLLRQFQYDQFNFLGSLTLNCLHGLRKPWSCTQALLQYALDLQKNIKYEREEVFHSNATPLSIKKILFLATTSFSEALAMLNVSDYTNIQYMSNFMFYIRCLMRRISTSDLSPTGNLSRHLLSGL